MELLRFITAGSVDDGKSTLIGRLLYDTGSILHDQLNTLSKQSKQKEAVDIDLALITDGLRAEREQGITIDVAYKYFTTPKRKFIIADAPGHKQYTRNMITGVSNVDMVIILVDARQGVVEQTKRHAMIAALMNVQYVVVAINKMDMVNYSKEAYQNIVNHYEELVKQIGKKPIAYIPMSALYGEGVVKNTPSMPWYQGTNLIDLLHNVEVLSVNKQETPQLCVQYVIRPKEEKWHDYRAYAGLVSQGTLTLKQRVKILPQQITSHVKSIILNNDFVKEAHAGDSIAIELQDDIDISRGAWIVDERTQHMRIEQQAKAVLVWMDDIPLVVGKKYILQIQSCRVKVMVTAITSSMDVDSLVEKEFSSDSKVVLNNIVNVEIQFAKPTVYAPADVNKQAGSGILIDEQNNHTVAAILFK